MSLNEQCGLPVRTFGDAAVAQAVNFLLVHNYTETFCLRHISCNGILIRVWTLSEKLLISAAAFEWTFRRQKNRYGGVTLVFWCPWARAVARARTHTHAHTSTHSHLQWNWTDKRFITHPVWRLSCLVHTQTCTEWHNLCVCTGKQTFVFMGSEMCIKTHALHRRHWGHYFHLFDTHHKHNHNHYLPNPNPNLCPEI